MERRCAQPRAARCKPSGRSRARKPGLRRWQLFDEAVASERGQERCEWTVRGSRGRSKSPRARLGAVQVSLCVGDRSQLDPPGSKQLVLDRLASRRSGVLQSSGSPWRTPSRGCHRPQGLRRGRGRAHFEGSAGGPTRPCQICPTVVWLNTVSRGEAIINKGLRPIRTWRTQCTTHQEARQKGGDTDDREQASNRHALWAREQKMVGVRQCRD